MGIYGGEPRAARRAGDDDTPAHARTALSEALAELRRLTRDPLFDGCECVLGELGNSPTGSDFGVDTVRKLRLWSAEHQRVAIELEAAARCCRLVEREINQRADALLELSAAKPRRRTGQFREIFRRGRIGSLPGAERLEAVARAPGLLPAAASAAPAAGNPAPAAALPEADIAASALGPLEVHVAGRRVPRWNSLKARAVFQYLLIHQDRPTRRDALMALQWPEHSHNSA